MQITDKDTKLLLHSYNNLKLAKDTKVVRNKVTWKYPRLRRVEVFLSDKVESSAFHTEVEQIFINPELKYKDLFCAVVKPLEYLRHFTLREFDFFKFVLYHEYGHALQYLRNPKETSAGWWKEKSLLYEKQNELLNDKNLRDNLWLKEYAYRLLPFEYDADTFAIDMLS